MPASASLSSSNSFSREEEMGQLRKRLKEEQHTARLLNLELALPPGVFRKFREENEKLRFELINLGGVVFEKVSEWIQNLRKTGNLGLIQGKRLFIEPCKPGCEFLPHPMGHPRAHFLRCEYSLEMAAGDRGTRRDSIECERRFVAHDNPAATFAKLLNHAHVDLLYLGPSAFALTKQILLVGSNFTSIAVLRPSSVAQL